MILFAALLALAASPDQAGADQPGGARAAECARLARSSGTRALAEASRWQAQGGGVDAFECAGLANAALGDYAAAARAFATAARTVDVTRDDRAATFWAQAGNAWLAAGDPQNAKAALDSALDARTLVGLSLGEAQLDRARAAVALGDATAARTDLDGALVNARDDPLAWLLSATLARREGDVSRARKDIGEALHRSPDDAAVQLEAGNVAALARDEAAARAAWTEAARLAPGTPAGRSALAALRQFDGAATASTSTPPAPVRQTKTEPTR